jgi:hypothetical protein
MNDPYDVSRVWVRNHHGTGWVTAFWTHLHRVGQPFGDLAWDHARRGLPGGTEQEIADAVKALLERAHHGPAPAPKRDRRVAARTRATSRPQAPPPEGDPQDGRNGTPEATGTDAPTAKVIPLPVFDPFAEADRPW